MSTTWISAKMTKLEDSPMIAVSSRENPLLCDITESLLQKNRKNKICSNPTKLNRALVKVHVLRKYTTSEPISSFIDFEAVDGASDQVAKMRVERLETKMSGASNQSELIAHVEGLERQLRYHAGIGEKVCALRITIQAIKMLCSPKFPQCYPSIFMLVSVVMDTFGDFVTKRLQEIAASNSMMVAALIKKGQDATVDLIPPEAVEVCNNWFLKISSIRELLPRICIELALAKCFMYVSKKMRVNHKRVVERLSQQIRGIADPLVASHIRWYLFLRAAELLRGTGWAAPLEQCLIDQLEATSGKRNEISDLSLLTPSIQWMIDCVLTHGPKERRAAVITKCKELIFPLMCPTLTECLIKAMNIDDLMEADISAFINHIELYTVPRERICLIKSLSLTLTEATTLPLTKNQMTSLLSHMYSLISDEVTTVEYISACEALLYFSCAHLGSKQIFLLLSMIRERVQSDTSGGNESAICEIISGLANNFDAVIYISSPDIFPLTRLIDSGKRRHIVANVLKSLPSNERYSPIVLELCRLLEQSLGGISSDEKMSYTKAIGDALYAAAPLEIEPRLSFLCEARRTLSDDDYTRSVLIHVALQASRSQSAITQRKRRYAVKTLFAFAHATLHAISCPFRQLRLGIDAATIAFSQSFVAQGEGLLQFCISVLNKINPYTTKIDGSVVVNDVETKENVLRMVAIGAVIPAHAKYGHLYLLKAILRWTDAHPWPATSSGQGEVFSAVMRVCSRAARGELMYQYKNCGVSNYISDPTFAQATTEMATLALERALWHMHIGKSDPTKQASLHSNTQETFLSCALFGSCGKSDMCRAGAAFSYKVADDVCASWVRQNVPSISDDDMKLLKDTNILSRLHFKSETSEVLLKDFVDELDELEDDIQVNAKPNDSEDDLENYIETEEASPGGEEASPEGEEASPEGEENLIGEVEFHDLDEAAVEDEMDEDI